MQARFSGESLHTGDHTRGLHLIQLRLDDANGPGRIDLLQLFMGLPDQLIAMHQDQGTPGPLSDQMGKDHRLARACRQGQQGAPDSPGFGREHGLQGLGLVKS